MQNKFCISKKTRVYDRNTCILYAFYFQNDCVESKGQYILQLFTLLGVYYIHKKMWALYKHNFPHFINEMKLYIQ